ncbi:MAG: cyclase family protein [Candidatus Sericytochromatia bacterium]|nr:cyclase family protein [Candidatus Tanganyikabacteria bacterium]
MTLSTEPRTGWRLVLEIGGERFAVRVERPLHLAIPLDFHGAQPEAFGLPASRAYVWRAGEFVGDVREGGSCNCEMLTLCPHGSGTHTECVGHLTDARLSVHAALREVLVPATVVTVTPERLPGGDAAITYSVLDPLLRDAGPFIQGLVVRTKPNDYTKKTRTWTGGTWPYFTPEIARSLRDRGVHHLVTDLPSLDPERDEGRLAAHRAFWDVAERVANPLTRDRTVTELAFIDAGIPDGRYLLNLQIAPFVLDAAPARPVLFEVQPL